MEKQHANPFVSLPNILLQHRPTSSSSFSCIPAFSTQRFSERASIAMDFLPAFSPAHFHFCISPRITWHFLSSQPQKDAWTGLATSESEVFTKRWTFSLYPAFSHGVYFYIQHIQRRINGSHDPTFWSSCDIFLLALLLFFGGFMVSCYTFSDET